MPAVCVAVRVGCAGRVLDGAGAVRSVRDRDARLACCPPEWVADPAGEAVHGRDMGRSGAHEAHSDAHGHIRGFVVSLGNLAFFQWAYLASAFAFLLGGSIVGVFGSLIMSTLFQFEAARQRRGGV